MKKILSLMAMFAVSMPVSLSVVACNGKASSGDKKQEIDKEIAENIASRDDYSIIVNVGDTADSLKDDLNGIYFTKYIVENLKQYYKANELTINRITKEDNTPLTDNDLSKKNDEGLKTIVYFTYNGMSKIYQLKLSIKIDTEKVDKEIIDQLSNYSGYEIEIEQESSLEEVKLKIRSSGMFTKALEQSPQLVKHFNIDNLQVSQLLDSDDKPFADKSEEDYPFSQGNPDLKAKFTFKYNNSALYKARLNIIVLYNNADKQQAVSQVNTYKISFSKINNIKKKKSVLKKIFETINPEYIISQLDEHFRKQMNPELITIDDSKIFASFDKNQTREVVDSFFTDNDPGGYDNAKFFVMWSYGGDLPVSGQYDSEYFITIHWTKTNVK